MEGLNLISYSLETRLLISFARVGETSQFLSMSVFKHFIVFLEILRPLLDMFGFFMDDPCGTCGDQPFYYNKIYFGLCWTVLRYRRITPTHVLYSRKSFLPILQVELKTNLFGNQVKNSVIAAVAIRCFAQVIMTHVVFLWKKDMMEETWDASFDKEIIPWREMGPVL